LCENHFKNSSQKFLKYLVDLNFSNFVFQSFSLIYLDAPTTKLKPKLIRKEKKEKREVSGKKVFIVILILLHCKN